MRRYVLLYQEFVPESNDFTYACRKHANFLRSFSTTKIAKEYAYAYLKSIKAERIKQIDDKNVEAYLKTGKDSIAPIKIVLTILPEILIDNDLQIDKEFLQE